MDIDEDNAVPLNPYGWEEQALPGEVAQNVFGMLMEFNEWVHRRKEQATVLGETHVSWRSSVDFTLPESSEPFRWYSNTPVALVPLDVLAKGPLTSFDIRDEWNAPVPTLTRRQNSLIACGGLTAWATGLFEEAGHAALPDELAELISLVVNSDPDDARDLVSDLNQSTDPEKRVLADDEDFMSILQWMAGGFVLIAVLHAASPGDRRVIKYAYERQFSSESETEERLRFRDKLPERLALKPTIIRLGVPMFRDCESFHFEAIPPEGTHFVDIALADLSRRTSEGDVEPNWTLGYQFLEDKASHVAHVSVSRTVLKDDVNPSEFLDPMVVFGLRVDKTGWLRSAMLASWLVAAFLLVTMFFVHAWDKPNPTAMNCLDLPANISPSDASEVVTASVVRCLEQLQTQQPFDLDPAGLMIGVVGLVSLAVVRSGEHAYTAKAIRWLRLVAVASSGLPIAAGWLIVFAEPDSNLLDIGWLALTGAAVGAAVLLTTAYLRKSDDPTADTEDHHDTPDAEDRTSASSAVSHPPSTTTGSGSTGGAT